MSSWTHGYPDEYVSEPYQVITRDSILDVDYLSDDEYDEYLSGIYDEQLYILRSLGYEYDGECYLITFLSNGNTYDCLYISEAIEMLALKDGADLVKFKDGSIGFVGYYPGYLDNAFKLGK